MAQKEIDTIAGITVNSTDAKSPNNFEQFLRCLNNDYVVSIFEFVYLFCWL